MRAIVLLFIALASSVTAKKCRHTGRVPTASSTSNVVAPDPSLAESTIANTQSLAVATGDKVRGVNLGGWLLLEPWITPTLFDATGNDEIVDEYTFTKLQDRAAAESTLKQHWDSFVTEQDFADIAAAGLNSVRIPIGYWAYDLQDGETYIGGQDAYLEKAIGWARTHGLKVLIDLHGLPGGQNGFDNSGQVGTPQWQSGGASGDNYKRTVKVITQIAQKYAAAEYADTVNMIGLVNEPAGFKDKAILELSKTYFVDGYNAVRHPYPDKPQEQSNQMVVISDALMEMDNWTGFMSVDKGYSDVAMDLHYYRIFDNGVITWDNNKRIQDACGQRTRLAAAPVQAFTGEWSVAPTDCAKYLNGRGKGARFDGTFEGSKVIGDCSAMTGSGDNFSQEYKDFLRKFWEVQTLTNERYGLGWMYWTWKNEESAEWSYKRGMELGFIPTKAGEHLYTLDQLCPQ